MEAKPTDMKFTYREAHQKWFSKTCGREGIVKLKKYVVAGTEHLRASERDAEFQKLPQRDKG